MHPPLQALVIMGVAGCGKSSVSQALCQRSGAHGIEGDSFHPAAQHPQDERRHSPHRRRPRRLAGHPRRAAAPAVAAGKLPVLTCSALKRAYRDRLRRAVPGLGIVYLELTPAVAAERVAQRPGHFMPATLIDSQFAASSAARRTLTLRLDATLPVECLAQAAHAWWLEHAAA
ncbi:gluconokinase [Pseudomonas aeruginosa]|nr:gluconokinase [Pseudomonas aeruginosa]